MEPSHWEAGGGAYGPVYVLSFFLLVLLVLRQAESERSGTVCPAPASIHA